MISRVLGSLWLGIACAGSLAAQGQKLAAPRPSDARPGDALGFHRFHPTVTPFPGIHRRDHLGSGLAMLGDVDGNGFADLALGASADHERGECWEGAVWIQFFGPGAVALGERKLRPGEGGFTGELEPFDEFGREVAALGDLDGDGVPDLAVGAPGDDDFQREAGAVWLLFLRADGTVKRHAKLLPPIVSVLARTPQGAPDIRVRGFGVGLAGLGDVDGDGTRELAVGARHGDHPLEDSGCVWILSLLSDGAVAQAAKISATSGLFTGHLVAGDDFGYTLSAASDLDGNGVGDLLVGAPGDDDLRSEAGALWRLSLAQDFTVATARKISSSASGGPALDSNSRFGEAAVELGDLDADGIVDLAVGAPTRGSSGSLWLLFLNADGTVKSTRRHFVPLGGAYPDLEERLCWPASLAALGDTDGNGIPEVLAAAPGKASDTNYGRVWRMNLRRTGALIDVQEYGLVGWSAPTFLQSNGGTGFGTSVLGLGDLDGDGGLELAAGQPNDNALWLLHLAPDRSVERAEKWSLTTGFPQGLFGGDDFGQSLTSLGDLDHNGFDDFAVGAPGDEDGHTGGGDPGQFHYGAVWIFFLGPQGAVVDVQKISELQGNLTTHLTQDMEFGYSLAGLGDLDHDSVPDLAVGAPGRGPLDGTGAVWILFLNADGTVKAEQRFLSLNPNVLPLRFGCSLASLGGGHLAIGELMPGAGRMYVATLGPGGLPSSFFEISEGQGGFTGTLANNARFGAALARIGDLDKDGLDELAVSSPWLIAPGQGPSRNGVLWILFLDSSQHVRSQLALGPEHPRIDLDIDAFGWGLGSCGDLDGDGTPDLLVGNTADQAFPVRCEFSSSSFGILKLQGAIAKKGL